MFVCIHTTCNVSLLNKCSRSIIYINIRLSTPCLLQIHNEGKDTHTLCYIYKSRKFILYFLGRRATVMECEHGPRKRSNALKKMIHLHGHKNAIKKIPNLTCPARLFVKKVRKFPQYRVPIDADPKVLRQLQEQSLKLIRHAGFNTGEIR